MVKLKSEQELSDEHLFPNGILKRSTHVDDAQDQLFPPGIGPANEKSEGDGDAPTPDTGEHLLPPLMDK